MALVLWIAIYVKLLPDMLAYVDDMFRWDFEGNLTYYSCYNEFYPTKQTRLLELWDEIGLLREKPK